MREKYQSFKIHSLLFHWPHFPQIFSPFRLMLPRLLAFYFSCTFFFSPAPVKFNLLLHVAASKLGKNCIPKVQKNGLRMGCGAVSTPVKQLKEIKARVRCREWTNQKGRSWWTMGECRIPRVDLHAILHHPGTTIPASLYPILWDISASSSFSLILPWVDNLRILNSCCWNEVSLSPIWPGYPEMFNWNLLAPLYVYVTTCIATWRNTLTWTILFLDVIDIDMGNWSNFNKEANIVERIIILELGD